MNFYISQLETECTLQIPIISPILITPVSNTEQCSNFNSVQSSDLIEFNINRSRCSSSSSILTKQRRVRFHSRDFIRRRSSTYIDLPLYINRINIPCRADSSSTRFRTQKSASTILEERYHKQRKSSNLSLESTANKNEEKSLLHTV